MVLTKYKLGDLIEIYDERNSNDEFTVNDVKGVSIQKKFIKSKANMKGVSLKPYKCVRPDCFVYVTVTSRNGNKITLAYNESNETYIVSSSYVVFKIIRKDILLSAYLFMYYNRPEFDRYSRFNSWGSARETFMWEDMCDIDIELPPIEIQQKYVDIYNTMKRNQKVYEKGLDDLKITLNILMNNCKHNTRKKAVGSLLKEIDNRNFDNRIKDVYGINVNKVFMPSIANTERADLSKYKIVNKGQFAFSGMQTGRDKCIRIALHNGDDPIIISPAYSVLENNADDVLSEYIMLWFTRKEVDRLGWFMSDASIRANLDMERFNEISIPVPNLEIQKDIVKIYHSYLNRSRNSEKLLQMLKSICPILIKGSIEEGRNT